MDKKLVQVGAAIIERDGRYFIARKAPGKKNAGFWEFPGGKLEPGETIFCCIKREMVEEFGMQVFPICIVGKSRFCNENSSIELIGVLCRNQGDPRFLTDHDRTAWVSLDQLKTTSLSPADIPLVSALQDHINSKPQL